MTVLHCKCGMEPISLEIKTPGRNRGRWYLRCPTGTCNFFKWDESPHSFIKHPEAVYVAQQPLSGQRVQPRFQIRNNQKDQETSLTKTKVKIVFTLISSQLIGMKVEHNSTLNPVIANIENIQWSERYNQWTIPASIPSYNLAIASLPTDTPNLQIEIDPIPPTLLDLIIENTLAEVQARAAAQSNHMTEIEEQFTNFVESPVYSKLSSRAQREAVKVGIERKGRIVLGNEYGIGLNEEGLALCKVYEQEWPVLVTCPGVLCQTWKEEVQQFFGLDKSEVCILDPKVHKKDMFTKKALRKGQMKQSITTTNIMAGMKRKSSPKSTKMCQPYKKRTEMKLSNPDYESESSSSEEEEEEDEAQHYNKMKSELFKNELREEDYQMDNIHSNNIKFYIASHEHTAKRRRDIAQQKFNIMLCTDSHLLKNWMTGEAKFIGNLLQASKRAILLSGRIRDALPVDTYNQLITIAPRLYPKFDTFARRYCDQKRTVFGLSYNGRCNQEEFSYIMDNNVWYCPRLRELKADFPSVMKQTVLINAVGTGPTQGRKKKSSQNVQVVEEEEEEEEKHAIDDDDEEEEEMEKALTTKSTEPKKEKLLDYLKYIHHTYRRPKIALIYQTRSVLNFVQTNFFIPKKLQHAQLNSSSTEDLDQLCQDFNTSRVMQYILIDINVVQDLDVDLNAVDLVVFLEVPLNMKKAVQVESFFENGQRRGPLMIKYLVAS